MNKTILSRKELEILEKIISNYAYVVSFKDIKSLLHGYSDEKLYQRIKSLVKRGWLIRIKQGYYAVANLESHSFSTVSPFVISHVFVHDSYVSFEFALNYHGIFDQLPNKVSAVTPLKSKKFHFQNIEYVFVRIKPEAMIGFSEKTIDGKISRIAEIEKTILDLLHFRKDNYTVGFVLEKLKEIKDKIDTDKIINYALLYPITIQRRLGFLFDIAGIDSNRLYSIIKGIPGFTKLTKTSKIFNSKWRLYYEDRFVK